MTEFKIGDRVYVDWAYWSCNPIAEIIDIEYYEDYDFEKDYCVECLCGCGTVKFLPCRNIQTIAKHDYIHDFQDKIKDRLL